MQRKDQTTHERHTTDVGKEGAASLAESIVGHLLEGAMAERLSNFFGPYLSKAVPADPWGHPYVYRSPGSRAAFDLLSYGRDGQPGGVADAADISH